MKIPLRRFASSRASARSVSCLLAAIAIFVHGCGFYEEGSDADTFEVRVQELTGFCTVQIEGHGAVDVENRYLPSVIACENGNAPLEALKAQAIAARTYAKFITESERRALQPTTRDQVWNCGREPGPIHFQAVRETAGQVLTYNDKLSVGFFVAGAIPSSSSCVATSSDRDPTRTERYVTYNQGRTGSQVRKTPLGSMSHPANRGAKSQNGAACLARQGWGAERILRFYYGDDARVQPLPQTCAGAPGGEPGEPNPGDICQLGVPSDSAGSECASSDETPNILPRSAWNARPPRRNNITHTPNRITVHHTVTSNTSTNYAAVVRQVQEGHFARNFSDVGYHFLVAQDGTIFRGADEGRIGSHVANQNTGNLGISLLGSYHLSVVPSDAQLKSVARLIAHLSKKYNIPIDRTHIKGHGERMATQCPGHQVLNRFDKILEWAKSDTVCTGPGSDEPRDEDQGDDEGDEEEVSYRYVRVTGVSNEPYGTNDTVEGFEVDAIYVERPDDNIIPETFYATDVVCSPGVNNPGAAKGAPDNDSCGNRAQTVAGVPVGADLVVKLPEPLRVGDILFVTQHAYRAALADCSPSSTARISVSEDGRVWKVLAKTATGNWRLTMEEEHFEPDEDDETMEGDSLFDFVTPRPGNWYTPKLTLKMRASDPAIVKVTYHAEEFSLGESTRRDTNFAVEREFNRFGQRRIIARGFNAAGQEIAKKEITITVTNFDGTIPGGQTVPGAPGGDGGTNSAKAEKIAVEGGKCQSPPERARCTNGRGGYSTGHCWRFVKRALERAGVNYNRLQNAGPCSAYEFQLAARGFRCNADANPSVLASIGLKKINVPTTQAPRGAIISWEKGCLGFHARYGHIEISQGNGYACSDYCGRIRGNAPSCASVYVPIN